MWTGVVVAALAFSGCRRGDPAPTAAPPPEPAPAADEAEPEPAATLAGVRVAVLIAEGFHSGEPLEPRAFLEQRGAIVTLVGPEPGEVSAYNDETTLEIALAAAAARVDDFDALVLPGGRGPAVLREHAPAVELARAFAASGRPVAAICHGPQVLVTAGVVEGRTLTAYSGVADEIRAAGGEYRDEEVVVDGNLITSRTPPDLPAFNAAILAALEARRAD